MLKVKIRPTETNYPQKYIFQSKYQLLNQQIRFFLLAELKDSEKSKFAELPSG